MVDCLPSKQEGNGAAPVPLENYTALFEAQFPYYLSIGMTEKQYWDGDPRLAAAYRKAERLRTERKNAELWLQGLYIYDAVCKASPLLHAFAKKGAKPLPYPSEPYALTEKQAKETETKQEKAVYDKGKKLMESFMIRNNKRFEGA